MIEMVDVVSVKALDGYRLWLRFSDGSEGVEDLSNLIENGGPMVEPLRDPELFARVFISFGVPTWPNGFDLDAINLHRQMRERGALKKPAA
ncbi:MAG: DUF2442 domain-containing protein [Rhizobiales bacterium]|jgi:hypothetical protein|nr:DUF2442 domain-containing protein [Hyphomicrobiales bacterium]